MSCGRMLKSFWSWSLLSSLSSFRVRGEIFDMYYLSIEGIVKELGRRGGGLPLNQL